ncbi:MAG: hypothetical protein U0931_25170 [Vulcanimicrobiota bacterium]
MDPKDLPQLTQGDLDDQALRNLVEDLSTLAEILEVRVKGSSEERAENSTLQLKQAVAAMKLGRVQGVQVRYRWEGAEWFDTLMRTGATVRVIRMKIEPRVQS